MPPQLHQKIIDDMTLHDIITHKRHVKGQNEEGRKWLFLNDYWLAFVEMPEREGGKALYRLIESKYEPSNSNSFPIFDLLTIEQVKDLIENNLP